MEAPLIPDENIVTLIDSWNTPLAEHLDSPLGYFELFHDTSDLGDLLARAVLERTAADVGVYNFGGVRETIDGGFITYRDLYRVEPFFNFVATIDLKGSDVTSVIASNFHATDITSFEPDTWYTVASSNFSVTFFEQIYAPDAINRQDYETQSVVNAIGEYLASEYPINLPGVLTVIDDCRASVTNLPDSYLIGGTPSELRDDINTVLLDAKNAISGDNIASGRVSLLSAIDHIDAHVNVSCPKRWFISNLNIILEYIGFPPIPTPTTTTYSESTFPSTTTTNSVDLPPLTLRDIVFVVFGGLLGVLVVVVGYSYIPVEKLTSKKEENPRNK